MYDPLILVNLNSDMSICLSWNCSWLNKIIPVHVVAPLCCRHLRHLLHLVCTVERLLLFPANWIIVKFPALFLQLILADVESVPSNCIYWTSIIFLKLLRCVYRLVHVVEIIVYITWVVVALLAKDRRLKRLVTQVSVLFLVYVTVVHVDILRILQSLFVILASACLHAAYYSFRVWPWLPLINENVVV